MRWNAPITLIPNERIPSLGILLACATETELLRGVCIDGTGTALEKGLVSLESVRARPFSARLAPWEEPLFRRDFTDQSLVLEGVPIGPAPSLTERNKLRGPRALWLEFVVRALRPGTGSLHLRVQSPDAPGENLQIERSVRVLKRRPPEALHAYLCSNETNGTAAFLLLERTLRWLSLQVDDTLSWKLVGYDREGERCRSCTLSFATERVFQSERWELFREEIHSGSLVSLELQALTVSSRVERLGILSFEIQRDATPSLVELLLSVGRERLPTTKQARKNAVLSLQEAVQDMNVLRSSVWEGDWILGGLNAFRAKGRVCKPMEEQLDS